MTMKAKFPGTCARCKRTFKASTPDNVVMIDWTPGVGATHATLADCARAQAAPAPVAAPRETVAITMKPIADFLMRAADKLKFPKVLFLAPGGGELKLYVAGPRSKFPGSIQVLVDGEWLGRITVEGEAHGQRLTGNAALVATINGIAADPVKAAKEYGALRGCCSFCSKDLTDEGSIEVGYGPVCAKHYGLPWKAQGSKALTTLVAQHGALSLVELAKLAEGGR